MTKRPKTRLSLLATTLAATLLAAPEASAQFNIKVLFWGGGATAHVPTHLRDTLATYFPAFNIQMDYRADSSNQPVWIHPDTLAQYDVMLVYTTNQNASTLGQTRLNDLIAWVNSGKVIVALHGATNTYINNNATVAAGWRGLMGGQFVDHAPNNNGGIVTRTAVGDTHGALLGTTMLPTSAANSGGSPYWDEGRRHNQYASDTIVLARSQIGAVNVPWIWVRPQGNGWVYYTASGHDGQVWKMPEWKGQVRRALTWGYLVKTTGIRGKAALDRLMHGTHGELIVPVKGEHSIEILDMQGRRVFFRGHSSARGHDVSALPAGSYGVRILPAAGEPFKALYVKGR
jgi:type 1 glutamine amidotransferase